MAHKSKNGPARILAGFLAMAVWQIAAVLVHNRLLLVGPIQVLIRLSELMMTGAFWQTIAFSFTRITLGFLIAFFIACIFAGIAFKCPMAEILLKPYMSAVRTIPVASFIVIALLWLSSKRLSVFISFLMVLPILYHNILQGLRSEDEKLLEMAHVFHMSTWKRLRGITIPALRPYMLSGCKSALGLCWKAGIAAEVISVAGGSIGGRLYDAKVYLEIADLFAWTFVIVAVSGLFEQIVLFLLEKAFGKLEAIE